MGTFRIATFPRRKGSRDSHVGQRCAVLAHVNGLPQTVQFPSRHRSREWFYSSLHARDVNTPTNNVQPPL
eukprot:5625490-Amphidinium_carterae.1